MQMKLLLACRSECSVALFSIHPLSALWAFHFLLTIMHLSAIYKRSAAAAADDDDDDVGLSDISIYTSKHRICAVLF